MAGSHRGVRIVDWSTESKRLALGLASFALVETLRMWACHFVYIVNKVCSLALMALLSLIYQIN